MAVVVTVTSANGTTRTFTVQDGKSLPAIATAPGDKVQIVDQNSPGVELVMDGDNVTLNWTGGSSAVSFQNLTLYLAQGQTEISVVDQDTNSTTSITSLDELLAGFSTAAGGTATGGGTPGGGFGSDGSIDEQGLEGGAGSPLGLGGGVNSGTPGDLGLEGDGIEPELLAGLAANTAPAAVADGATTNEDTPVTVDVLDNDSDADAGAQLSVVAVDETGTNGTVRAVGDGANDTFSQAQDLPRAAFGAAANPELQDAALPSVEIRGNQSGIDDVDWFRIDVQAGESIMLDIDHAMPGFDAMVWVYDAAGNPVTMDDDGGMLDPGSSHGYDSYLITEALPAGTYYIARTGYYQDPMDPSDSSGYASGDYVLRVSIVPTGSSTGFGPAPTTFIDGEAVAYDPRGAYDYLAEGETATDTFEYTVSDENGATDTEVVTVTITGVNDAPVAQNVSVAGVQEDGAEQTFSFLADDVDSDDDAASLSYSIVQGPAEGSVTVEGSTFTFNPGNEFQDLAAGETRDVTFTYRATDGHEATSAVRTATVTVTGTNDAPSIAIADGLTYLEAGSAAVSHEALFSSFALGDVDNGSFAKAEIALTGATDNGDVLRFPGSSTNLGGGDRGGIFNGADGQIAWTFDNSEKTMTLVAQDGGFISQADVEAAVRSIQFWTDEQQPGQRALEVVIRVTDAGDGADVASQATTEQTVSLTITGENDIPAVANPTAAYAGEEDAAILLAGNAGAVRLAGNLTDLDSQGAGQLTLSVGHGTIAVAKGTLNLTITGDGTDTVVITGNLGQIRDLLQGDGGSSVGYLGHPDWNGADSLTLAYSDQGDQGHPAQVVTTTAAIDVASVNDAPVAQDVSVGGVVEDGAPQTFSFVAADVDGDPLTYAIVDGPAEGSVTVEDGTFTFDPGADFQDLGEGEMRDVTFTYQATDGHGGVTETMTVTVTVTGSNEPAEIRFAINDQQTDHPNFAGAGNFAVDEASGFGEVDVYGAAQMNISGVTGTDSVEILYDDPDTASASVASGWNSIKSVQATSDDAGDVTLQNFVHVDVRLGDSDDEGDAVADGSTVIVEGAKRGTVVTGGGDDVVEIDAATNDAGWSNLFSVSTGAGDDTVAITGSLGFTVASVDAGAGDDTVTVDGDYASATLTGGDGDDNLFGGDGDDVINGGAGSDFVEGGDGDDVINGDGGLDFLYGDGGNDTILGGGAADVIEGGDGDDVLRGGGGLDVIEGGAGNDRLYGDGASDNLGGGDGADTLYGCNGDDWLAGNAGDDQLHGEGGLDTAFFTGADYDAGDAAYSSDTWTVTGDEGTDTLTGIERADLGTSRVILAKDASASVVEDNSVSIDVLGNLIGDGYTAADLASLAISTAPEFGTASIVDNKIVYTPDDHLGEGETDEVTFNYTVTDRDGYTATRTVTITVAGTNDGPVITSNGGGDTAAVPVAENTTVVTTVTSSDADLGATKSYSIVGGADAAKFQIDPASGVLSFVSAPNYEAPADAGGDNVYDVQVQASDGSLADTQSIAVTVTDVPEVVATDGDADWVKVITGTGGTHDAWIEKSDLLWNDQGANLRITGVHDNEGDVGTLDPFVWFHLDKNEASDSFTYDVTGTAGSESGVSVSVERGNNLSFNDNDEVVYGKTGNDTVNLLGGDDVMHGDHGNDTIDGGSGNDFLDGGEDEDEIAGGVGNDVLFGGDGDDELAGGIGNDVLYGGDDDDEIAGGDGDDVIYGGNEDDELTGGEGDDTFVIESDDIYDGTHYVTDKHTDRITDFEHGDTLDLSDVVDWLANGNTGREAELEIRLDEVENDHGGTDVNVVARNGRDSGALDEHIIVVIENQTEDNLALDDQGNITANP